MYEVFCELLWVWTYCRWLRRRLQSRKWKRNAHKTDLLPQQWLYQWQQWQPFGRWVSVKKTCISRKYLIWSWKYRDVVVGASRASSCYGHNGRSWWSNVQSKWNLSDDACRWWYIWSEANVAEIQSSSDTNLIVLSGQMCHFWSQTCCRSGKIEVFNRAKCFSVVLKTSWRSRCILVTASILGHFDIPRPSGASIAIDGKNGRLAFARRVNDHVVARIGAANQGWTRTTGRSNDKRIIDTLADGTGRCSSTTCTGGHHSSYTGSGQGEDSEVIANPANVVINAANWIATRYGQSCGYCRLYQIRTIVPYSRSTSNGN